MRINAIGSRFNNYSTNSNMSNIAFTELKQQKYTDNLSFCSLKRIVIQKESEKITEDAYKIRDYAEAKKYKGENILFADALKEIECALNDYETGIKTNFEPHTDSESSLHSEYEIYKQIKNKKGDKTNDFVIIHNSGITDSQFKKVIFKNGNLARISVLGGSNNYSTIYETTDGSSLRKYGLNKQKNPKESLVIKYGCNKSENIKTAAKIYQFEIDPDGKNEVIKRIYANAVRFKNGDYKAGRVYDFKDSKFAVYMENYSSTNEGVKATKKYNYKNGKLKSAEIDYYKDYNGKEHFSKKYIFKDDKIIHLIKKDKKLF